MAYQAKITLNEIPFAAHHLIAILIQTIHKMILKNLQNGSSKGISTLLLVADADLAAMEEQFLTSLILIIPTVPVPVHHMEMLYDSAAEPHR